MDIDPAKFETVDIHNTPIAKLCDVAMHRLLCDTCNPDAAPCEFYVAVEVEGRDMMLTLTATLTDSGRH